MKRKIKISTYIQTEFEAGNAPAPTTVRRWLAEGHIAGQKIGGIWFVFHEQQETKNELIERILCNG